MLMEADGSNKTPLMNTLCEGAMPVFVPAKTVEAERPYS